MKRNPNCDLCAIKDSFLTKCLAGYGKLNSSIVFVGDYPYVEDFKQSRPFANSAGNYLSTVFAKYGETFSNYYFTNVLGCKPFDDKKPSKGELAICRPYYIEEIQQIKPKLVVALGATALESLVSQTGISKLRGNLIWSNELNCYIYPTYHPSAIMRNIELVGTFEADIQEIFKLGNSKEEIKVEKSKSQHIFIRDIEKFRILKRVLLETSDIIATDIESTGLLYLEDRILCISFSWDIGKAAVVPLVGRFCRQLWTKEELEEIIKGLVEIFETKQIVLQNGKYDLKFFINELKVNLQKLLDNFVGDTMLAHVLLEEEEKHGLKELAWKYTDFGGYEEELSDFKNSLKNSINKKLPLLWIETSNLSGQFKENISNLKYVNQKYRADNKGIIEFRDNTFLLVSVAPKTLSLDINSVAKKESLISQIREWIHTNNIEHLCILPITPSIFLEEVLVEALKATRSKKDMVDEDGNAVDDFCYDVFPEETLWKYNAIDADVTFRVWKLFKPRLEQEGLFTLFEKLVMPQNKVLLQMEMNGIGIDMGVLDEIRDRLTEEKDKLHESIVNTEAVQKASKLILEKETQKIIERFRKLSYPDWKEDKVEVAKLQKAEQTVEVKASLEYYKKKAEKRYIEDNLRKLAFKFNLDSLDQLAILLFDILHFPIISKTPSGNPQMNIENLDIWAKTYPIADSISKYKSFKKFIGLFFDGIKKRVSIDGRLRTDYQQTTVTGRLKSSNPNLQNIPKRQHGYVDPKDVRAFFVAPEGSKLVHADLAQAEFRLWCEYAQDETLMEDLKNDMDIHRKVAAYIFRKEPADITKDERSKAKFAVFGLIYGRGAQSIADEYDLTLEQAQNVSKYFFALYPKCAKWIEGQKRIAIQQGYVKNYFGRIRHLPLLTMLQNKNFKDFDNHTQAKLAECQRQCVNAPIQGAVGDFMGLILVRLQKLIDKHNYPVKLMLQIHDAVICEVKDEFVDEWTKILKVEMTRPPGNFRTILDNEIEVGQNWRDLKVVEVNLKL